jgi:hypothetical protein
VDGVHGRGWALDFNRASCVASVRRARRGEIARAVERGAWSVGVGVGVGVVVGGSRAKERRAAVVGDPPTRFVRLGDFPWSRLVGVEGVFVPEDCPDPARGYSL